jgi:Phosphoinositide phospholipase C, Ca2+-dependent
MVSRTRNGWSSWLVLGGLGCGASAGPVGSTEGASSTAVEGSTHAGATLDPSDTTTPAATTTAPDPDSTGPSDPDASTGDPTALDDVLRLHHAQWKGTHNSYHLEPPLPFDASHEYSHAPLPEQLDAQGVRAFELDVHRELDETLSVYHILGIDSQTTCDTLEACLQQIKGWSDEHPEHLPVVIWLELKDDTGGLPLDEPEPLQLLDDVVTGVFPPAQLLTPDDVQGEFPTLRARLQAEGWPTLGELRGQVLVTILDTDAPAELYTEGYTTLAGRPLFVRADSDQLELPWAAIAKLGSGETEAIATAHAGHLLVATNVCGAGDSDDECFAARQAAIDAGIHMLKDDFPAPVPEREYWLDFPDGNPARCNPVTAPRECTSAALESL